MSINSPAMLMNLVGASPLQCTVYSPCGRYLIHCVSLTPMDPNSTMSIEVFYNINYNTVGAEGDYYLGNQVNSPSLSHSPPYPTSAISPPLICFCAEVNEPLVTEITTQAGVQKDFAGFVQMTFAALLGQSQSVRFYVETFGEMKRRVLKEVGKKGEGNNLRGNNINSSDNTSENSLPRPECEDKDNNLDCSNIHNKSSTNGGTEDQTRFLTIDYRAEFLKAIFPIPLIAKQTTQVPVGFPRHQQLSFQQVAMANTSQLLFGAQLNNNLSKTKADNNPIKLSKRLEHEDNYHNNDDTSHSSIKINNNVNNNFSFNSSSSSATTASYSRSDVAHPNDRQNFLSPMDRSGKGFISKGSDGDRRTSKVRQSASYVSSLESELTKLRRENAALTTLSRDKMSLMREECAAVEKRIIKDQEELRHFKKESARLNLELSKYKRSVNELKGQLRSAHAKIRALGSSPSSALGSHSIRSGSRLYPSSSPTPSSHNSSRCSSRDSCCSNNSRGSYGDKGRYLRTGIGSNNNIYKAKTLSRSSSKERPNDVKNKSSSYPYSASKYRNSPNDHVKRSPRKTSSLLSLDGLIRSSSNSSNRSNTDKRSSPYSSGRRQVANNGGNINRNSDVAIGDTYKARGLGASSLPVKDITSRFGNKLNCSDSSSSSFNSCPYYGENNYTAKKGKNRFDSPSSQDEETGKWRMKRKIDDEDEKKRVYNVMPKTQLGRNRSPFDDINYTRRNNIRTSPLGSSRPPFR